MSGSADDILEAKGPRGRNGSGPHGHARGESEPTFREGVEGPEGRAWGPVSELVQVSKTANDNVIEGGGRGVGETHGSCSPGGIAGREEAEQGVSGLLRESVSSTNVQPAPECAPVLQTGLARLLARVELGLSIRTVLKV